MRTARCMYKHRSSKQPMAFCSRINQYHSFNQLKISYPTILATAMKAGSQNERDCPMVQTDPNSNRVRNHLFWDINKTKSQASHIVARRNHTHPSLCTSDPTTKGHLKAKERMAFTNIIIENKPYLRWSRARLTLCAIRLWRKLVWHRQSHNRWILFVTFPAKSDQLGLDRLAKGDAILKMHAKSSR